MMNTWLKYYGLCIAVILLGAGRAAASPPAQMGHDLTVRLEPSEQLLRATDVVTVSHMNRAHLVFELAEHISLETLTLNSRATRFSFKNGWLRIPIEVASERYRLKMVYVGRFTDEVASEPLNMDNPGFGVTGSISPRGTMLLSGSRWYPRGENTISEYHITVDAPEGVVAVTTGHSLGHVTEKGRSLSRWKVDRSLHGIPLVAGPYTVTTRRFGEITAVTYFSPPLQHLSDDYLNATGRYLKLYQELFGPYPFGQFAVVENFFPTGYGFPSFTLLGRRVLQLPFIIHTSLGHEIAHCWWGNGVLVDPSQGNWSEGLTTYVSDYLYKERRGEGRDHRLQWLRNYADLVDASNDFPASQFRSRMDPVTKAVGYDKVAMVFHMLRQIVGEDVFWPALRDVYARHRFKVISWSDFQSAFEARSKISLERFFRQWVTRAGAPRLSLSNVIATSSNHGYVISGSVEQEKPYYDLKLDLALTTDQDSILHALKVSGARTSFTITTSRPPKELQADPDVHLFRRLSAQEVPPTVNGIKGASEVAIVVAKHFGPEGLHIARRLSVALGLSNPRIGLEADFSHRHLSRHDILFVGQPKDTQWIPADVTRFSISPEAFELKGERYDRNEDSFFGVFAHPHKLGAVALYIPTNPPMGEKLATKIPHYGKYSYLVFKDTRNQVKGTWAVTHSCLVVRWSKDSDASMGGTR
jgi:hypothetical protein